MSLLRSPNCSRYTDTVSTLVEVIAESSNGYEPCTASLTSFSCQKNQFETPDEDTASFMKEAALVSLKEKGCSVGDAKFTFRTNIVGAQEMEYSPSKLAELGMASNCFLAGNDANEATHKIRAVCHPMYDMKDKKGNVVRDYTKTFVSELSACDVSDTAVSQLEEDARKVAAHNASKNGFVVERPAHLACRFSILPQL